MSTTVCFSKNIKRIGLVHPSVKNLEKLSYLIDHKIIDSVELEIVGIFHITQKTELDLAKKYLKKHSFRKFSFKLIENNIPLDSLFTKNKASAEFTEIFKSTDGMIFFGGPDIPPATYGEKAFITCDIYSNERTWELSFIHHLIGGIQNEKTTPLLNQRPDYLIFGICLGMQEMNVASGGTMYQDIPFQIYDKKSFEEILEMPIEQQHKNYLEKLDSKYKDKTYGTFHSIVIPTKSFLSFDSTIIHPNIACIHHQCIKLLGEHFIVSATSSDTKIIEAIENVKFKNVYGVQFHPEISNLFDEDFKYPISKNDTYQLDETSRKFHHLIWKDFSNRLRLQTYNSN